MHAHVITSFVERSPAVAGVPVTGSPRQFLRQLRAPRRSRRRTGPRSTAGRSLAAAAAAASNRGCERRSRLSSTNATSGTSSTTSSREPFDPIATRKAIRHTHASSDPSPRNPFWSRSARANASCTTSHALSTLPVTDASITWNAPLRRRYRPSSSDSRPPMSIRAGSSANPLASRPGQVLSPEAHRLPAGVRRRPVPQTE